MVCVVHVRWWSFLLIFIYSYTYWSEIDKLQLQRSCSIRLQSVLHFEQFQFEFVFAYKNIFFIVSRSIMEIFELFRMHLAMCGISTRKSTRKSRQKYPFNRKNSIVLITIGLNAIFLVNFVDEANTFEEYTDILYEIIVMCSLTIIFFKIVWKSADLMTFIENIENTINNREFASFSASINRTFNWIRWILHFVRVHFESRVANIIHQDQLTHSKMDKNFAFYRCHGTRPLHNTFVDELLRRLFHHWCGQWGIQIAMLYVVISIESNQIGYHRFIVQSSMISCLFINSHFTQGFHSIQKLQLDFALPLR